MRKYRAVGIAVFVVAIAALGFGLAHTRTVSAKGGKTPPTIDDLPGTYAYTDQYMEYDLDSGAVTKYKDRGTVTITKVDDETVNLEFDISGNTWDEDANYDGGGVLVAGYGDDDSFADDAGTELIVLNGNGAKGQWMEYDTTEGWTEVGTESFKGH